MFSLSQFTLSKMNVVAPENIQTYSVMVGLIIYAIIYVYILMYKNEYLTLFNQYIIYIIGLDCLIATFYYYQSKKQSITFHEEHDNNMQFLPPLRNDETTESEEEESYDDDDQDVEIEEFTIPDEVSNLLKAQSEMFEKGILNFEEALDQEQNEDAKIKEIAEEQVEDSKDEVKKPEKKSKRQTKKKTKITTSEQNSNLQSTSANQVVME